MTAAASLMRSRRGGRVETAIVLDLRLGIISEMELLLPAICLVVHCLLHLYNDTIDLLETAASLTAEAAQHIGAGFERI